MAYHNSSSSNQPQQLNQANDDDASNSHKKNLIILVDKDSNDKLDELFEKTLSNNTTLHKPYKMRNLPASFFKPPPSGSKSPSVSHSRENSADSAFGSGTTILGSNSSNQSIIVSTQSSVPVIARELIHHSRAHSSPASLGKLPLNINLNLSALTLGNTIQNNSPGTAHNNSTVNSSGISIPSNKQTQSQLTKINHNNSNVSSLASNNNIALDKSIQHNHSRGRSYDISSLQQQLHFGDLPPGWEQAKTHDGKIYYIKYILLIFMDLCFKTDLIFLVTIRAQHNGKILELILYLQLYHKIIYFHPHPKIQVLRQFLVRQFQDLHKIVRIQFSIKYN